MKKTTTLIILTFLTLNLYASKDRGGGDAIALEVREIGRALIKASEDERHENTFRDVDKKKFKETIKETIIQSISERPKDRYGNEKTAVWYKKEGKKYIEIYNKEFNELTSLFKQRLAFHEFLSLMELEDSDAYAISERLEAPLMRPIYGSCSAKNRHLECTVGLRMDTLMKSLEGSYVCWTRKGRNLYSSRKLLEKNTEWKPVSLMQPKKARRSFTYASKTLGFGYSDDAIKFEVATPHMTGWEIGFSMTKKVWGLFVGKEIKEVPMSGKCNLVYR